MAIASAGPNFFWFFVIAAILAAVFAGITFYLLDKQKKQRKYAELVEVMADCRGKPMGIIVGKGGDMIPFVIEHDPKNKGLVKSKYTLLHPEMAGPLTKHKFKNGPEVYFYVFPSFMPTSMQSAAALGDVGKKLRADTRFSWIPSELDLIASIFNETDSSPRDLKQLVEVCCASGAELPEGYFKTDEEEFGYSEDEESEEEESEDEEFDEGEFDEEEFEEELKVEK